MANRKRNIKENNMLQGTAPEEFSKNQLISCEKFRSRKDLLNAILQDDRKYDMDTVEKKISEFLKGKVK